MKTRIPHHTTTAKRRAKNLPRSEKIIRSWEAEGWAYELAQHRSGDYILYGVEIDGDGWRIESAATIKATLATVTPAEVEALLSVEE
jgi:hypothetical protein